MPPTGRALLEDLIRIDSVNPSLVAGARGEADIASYVASWGRDLGLHVDMLDEPTGRPSVVLTARGRGGGSSLMLYAHLDTVGVEGMDAPFEPREREGWLYGRGAIDMKAGLAACMGALADAAARGLGGDVVLAAVADEEHASVGMEAVLERYRADAAVVTEPTDLEIHVAHRGFAVYEVVTQGVSSHTSQPERGVNAVGHMGRILHEVTAWQTRIGAQPPHPLLGRGSVQPVTVRGGEQLFVTPARAALQIERRTIPGETDEVVAAELREVLARAGEGVAGFDAAWRLEISRPPFEISEEAPIVRALAASAEAVLDRPASIAGAPYWMDAALLAEAGIPTAVFGPTGKGLHAADERVELESVASCQAVLAALAERVSS